MATTKNMGVIFQMFQTVHPLNFMFILSPESDNVNMLHCLLSDCEFSISDVTQSIVFQFLQNLQKHFRFSVIFSWKTVQIVIFNIEYLSGSADFHDFGLILQDFEWPFR